MVVRIDEPRSDHAATGIDDAVSLADCAIGHVRDYSVAAKDGTAFDFAAVSIHRNNHICIFYEQRCHFSDYSVQFAPTMRYGLLK